ncbi:unnamed protein product [Cuscuta epithymum]|uniref:Transposase MuDR plant domain-containing protein n=1 Tax=Cuscuta epithymum TaxID=186058 RepID=A0AAV0DR28_9ASTE|nr:unnamed protein product [Cuscuta epithymum]CAH9126045.1 unnamed protein product [Cuscuta epithymum]
MAAMDRVSLIFWHGGLFMKKNDKLLYLNGECKSFDIDPDELCWFWLEELAKKCGSYTRIEEIYYLVPGLPLDNGLRRVYNDREVLEMSEIVLKARSLDLYVVHGLDQAEQVIMLPSTPNTKTSIESANENQLDGCNVVDHEVQTDIDDDEAELEGEAEDCYDDEAEVSDDEYRTAKNRVKECNNKLFEIAKQLQKEAEEGILEGQRTNVNNLESCLSEYEDTEEEIDTPPDSAEEALTDNRNHKKNDTFVDSNTDFSTFEWKVGQRFATREDFKRAVAKFAILQGRNLSFAMSNKKRQQRLGVKCVDGCPFRLYSSWDSRRATFVVKTVVGKHNCHRNMKRNKQLKSTWVARQFLDVFKARPHWPAKEIIETVKRAYKVIISRGFAYKVKYRSHKMLHGSMEDHYKKVGRYLRALKNSSPGTELVLVTDVNNELCRPVFQRLFTCFEGLQKGWKEGCRKVICVDACFLKTFLGGQLLCAIGRDGNDQIYPIAWAAVEGENNRSWEWFFKLLQKCLDLEEGADLAIISDEHQVRK